MASGLVKWNAYDYAQSNSIIDLGQIAAAGENSSSVFLIDSADPGKAFKTVLFQIVIAAITTSLVVRLQGSLDNENWFNASEEDGDCTYTANGAYAIRYDGKGEIRYIRLYFVSETGGTDATIDIKAKVV